MSTERSDAGPSDFAPVESDEPRTAVAERPFSASPVSQANETGAAIFGARERAAIEARTIVALRNPRNIELVRKQLLEACARFRFADAAMYEKPVGEGKAASGLSIRFAEEFMRTYGNFDVAVNVVSENDESRTLEAVAVDLEKNVSYRAPAVVSKYVWRLSPRKGDEVILSKENSRGKITYKIRADDDALFTASQAASAKASREATLKHCPADLREECEERITETLAAIGGKDPEKFRDEILKAFFKVGIEKPQLDEYLGKSVSLLNVAEMLQLRRLCQALKQGETDWAEVMRSKDGSTEPTTPKAEPGKGTAGLKKDLSAKKEKGAKTAPVAQAPAGPAPDGTAPVGDMTKTVADADPAPAPSPSFAEALGEFQHPVAQPTRSADPAPATETSEKAADFQRWTRLTLKEKRTAMDQVQLDQLNKDWPEFAEKYGPKEEEK